MKKNQQKSKKPKKDKNIPTDPADTDSAQSADVVPQSIEVTPDQGWLNLLRELEEIKIEEFSEKDRHALSLLRGEIRHFHQK